MTTAIKTSVYAKIEEAGETAIPARVLYDIINKFPAGEIRFARKEAAIQIQGANSSAMLSEMDAQQFPPFPVYEGEADHEVTLERQLFKEMIEKTAFSAYVGEDRPIFTGLLFETDPEEETLSVVAIDGIHMAKKTANVASKSKLKAIIPAKMLKEASRILGDGEEEVCLRFGEQACFLKSGNVEIFTRLLDGEYINYQAIIPAQYKTRVRINAGLFERSLELMMVLAREDSSNLIRMSIEDSCIDMPVGFGIRHGTGQGPGRDAGRIFKNCIQCKIPARCIQGDRGGRGVSGIYWPPASLRRPPGGGRRLFVPGRARQHRGIRN